MFNPFGIKNQVSIDLIGRNMIGRNMIGRNMIGRNILISLRTFLLSFGKTVVWSMAIRPARTGHIRPGL